MNPERIIDTDIVSYLMKRGPLTEAYARRIEGRLIGITFITVGELYFGAEKGQWGRRRRATLETTIQSSLL